MKMLDLFAGRCGVSREFARRGWECVCVDLVEPENVPDGCTFMKMDVLNLGPVWARGQGFDFAWSSSPCEQFSVCDMRHFHPDPPFPYLGEKLFKHGRMLCEAAGCPFVLENVRGAQPYMGAAVNHCGPFYLWGSAVPALLPGGVVKGISFGSSQSIKAMGVLDRRSARREHSHVRTGSGSRRRKALTAAAATIPPELAVCVADYVEGILRAVAA